MKKVHIFLATAMLFAGAANAQRATFQPVNGCVDCPAVTVVTGVAEVTNPNNMPTFSAAAIDNCSVVIQGQGTGTQGVAAEAFGGARGDDNRAVVDQMGTGNTAKLVQQEGDTNYGLQNQNGSGNGAIARVFGNNNTTLQFQKGNDNRAGINVDQVNGVNEDAETTNGNRNFAQQRQSGNFDNGGNRNNADIKQFGNDNLASQEQLGDDNSGAIRQHTSNSLATQRQDGNSNIAQTFQGNFANTPVVDAQRNQRSCIEQGGNGNQAVVNQDVR